MHLRSSPQDYQLWFGDFKILFETVQGRVMHVGTIHICKDQTFCGVNKSIQWQ